MSDRPFSILSAGQEPRFPDRCASCQAQSPGDYGTLRGRAFHPAHLILFFFLGRVVHYEVPLCPPCQWDQQQVARRRRFTLLLGVGLGLGSAWGLRQVLPPAHLNLALIGAAMVALAPPLLWKAFAPPPIELTVERAEVRFEFRDAEYAEEFARLNAPEPGAPTPLSS